MNKKEGKTIFFKDFYGYQNKKSLVATTKVRGKGLDLSFNNYTKLHYILHDERAHIQKIIAITTYGFSNKTLKASN